MDDKKGYAVYFFPPALEVLGEAIKPYLVDGPGGAHLLCREIDTGGALVEMTLDGLGADGVSVELEIMVPSNMVRMIVSVRGEEAFGFGPRLAATLAGLSAQVSTATPADSAPAPGPAPTPVVAAAPAVPPGSAPVPAEAPRRP